MGRTIFKLVCVALLVILTSIMAEGMNSGKIAIYWRGDKIYSSSNRDIATQDIIDRGFTHILVMDYLSYRDAAISYFHSKGLKVLLEPKKDHYSLKKADHVDPYGSNYVNRYDSLKTIFDANKSKLDGLVDDFEIYPFNKKAYNDNGGIDTNQTIIYPETRVNQGKTSPYVENRESFKQRYSRWNNLSLTVDKIKFNNPVLSSVNQDFHDKGFLLGWYGPYWDGSGWVGDATGDYYQVMQTFKPTNNRISRIDVKIMRQDNADGICPGGDISKHYQHIAYYLVNTNASGEPVPESKVGSFVGILKCEEVNYSGGSPDYFSNIDYLSLYFDPDELGTLDTSKEYAVVLKFDTFDYSALPTFDEINWSHYKVAVKSGNPYTNGKLYKGRQGTTSVVYDDLDLNFKVYYPSSSYNGNYNQLYNDWVEFQCENMKLIAQDYKNMISGSNLYLYSGYSGMKYYEENIDERYSADWDKLKYPADYVICGYTAKPEHIVSMNFLTGQNAKFIGGVLDEMGSFAEVYNMSAYGVMYAYWSKPDAGYSVPGATPQLMKQTLVSNTDEEKIITKNYPNPFNPSTTIEFNLPEQSFVTLKVYNSLGQEVAKLADNMLSEGVHKIKFDASHLSSGLYFYTLKTEKAVLTEKILLMK